MAIKFDMKKAYDKLDRGFIRKYLNDLGFSNVCTNWVMQCITTPSFRVIVNKKPWQSFLPEKWYSSM